MGQLAGLAGIVRGAMAKSEQAEEPLPDPVEEPKPAKVPGPRLTKPIDKPILVPTSKAVIKSKDPAWKGYSLFLKKDTHSEMNFLLRRLDAGEDMSDLVQRLVADWVAANR